MVRMERSRASVDRDRGIHRPVARRQSPDRVAVITPLIGIGDCIGMLSDRSAPRVLEIVDAVRSDIGILYAAKIDPDLRVLMAEQRGEENVLLPVERPPAIGLVILGPCTRVSRVRWRAEGQEDDD